MVERNADVSGRIGVSVALMMMVLMHVGHQGLRICLFTSDKRPRPLGQDDPCYEFIGLVPKAAHTTELKDRIITLKHLAHACPTAPCRGGSRPARRAFAGKRQRTREASPNSKAARPVH